MLQWEEVSFFLMGSRSQVALGVAGGAATALCLFGAPAFALQTFTFSNAKFWDNLDSPSDNFNFNGTITGSFDWDEVGGGTGNFSNVNVTFTLFDGSPAPTSIIDVPSGTQVQTITFTNGQLFTINSLSTLVFDNGGNGNNSIGAVVDLAGPLGTFPDLEPSDPGDAIFTSYFCRGNFGGGGQGISDPDLTCPQGQLVEFNEVSGSVVPAPLSGLALTPVALLYRLRKRYRYIDRLAEATPVSNAGAELQ